MESTELAVKTESNAMATQSALPRFTEEQIISASFDTSLNLPTLENTKKHFMSLEKEYWTPEKDGEEKHVWVLGVSMEEMADMATGELKMVECVTIVERFETGLRRFMVASKILVGTIKAAINSGVIIPNSHLTPVSITYIGERKNKHNAFKSKRWQVTPLVIAG